MLQYALGEETFRKGVEYYLTEMKFRAAEADDLARGLEKAAFENNRSLDGLQLKSVIDSWALKSHYPVVDVSVRRNGRLELTQSRFKYRQRESEDLWYIPITIATEAAPSFNNPETAVWLKTQSLTLPATYNSTGWVILNVQQVGHYRVNYTPQLWARLVSKLLSPQFYDLHHINRAQLVDDALNLARGGVISYKQALQVTEYLAQETEFLAWMAADKGFTFMNRLLVDSGNYDNFKQFINDMVSPLYSNLGIEDGGNNELLSLKTSRNIAVNWACLSGDASCITETVERIREVIRNPSAEIAPDLQFSIYCNGLRKADEVEFTAVWTKMQESTNQGFRSTLIRALGCAQEPQLQRTFLDSTLNTNPEEVNYRNTERSEVLTAVYVNGGKTGLESAIGFIGSSVNEIEAAYKGSSNPTKNACRGISGYVASEQMLRQFEATLDELEAADRLTPAERATFVANSRENIDWVTANDAEIGEFLEEYLSKPKRFQV